MASIFIGTVLLETNRWTTKIPTFQVSSWTERFQKDGFDGIELWENHAVLASEEEKEAIKRSGIPVAVYNSYAGFLAKDEEQRLKAAEMVRFFDAGAVKYNFGKEISHLEEYISSLQKWAEQLPQSCVLLCECHPGTIMEEPQVAAQVFQRLEDPRFQAIVHAMTPPDRLEAWFDALGKRISHTHIQLRDNQHAIMLRRKPEFVKSCIEVLKEKGFKGTYTVEFTEGIRTPDENIEGLYACALDDLKVLRELT